MDTQAAEQPRIPWILLPRPFPSLDPLSGSARCGSSLCLLAPLACLPLPSGAPCSLSCTPQQPPSLALLPQLGVDTRPPADPAFCLCVLPQCSVTVPPSAPLDNGERHPEARGRRRPWSIRPGLSVWSVNMFHDAHQEWGESWVIPGVQVALPVVGDHRCHPSLPSPTER